MFRRYSVMCLTNLITIACVPLVHAQPVTLQIAFKLTDLDYKPLPNVPVRLVFGSDPDWQGSNADQRFVTDANGEARVTASVTLARKLRKKPTNFVSSLLSAPELTNHLMAAAELEYMNFHWLYAVDLYRFAGGDTLLDDLTVYTADSRGRFTRKAEHNGLDWKMADLGGLVLTSPGYDPWNFALQPDASDPSGKRWTLQLALKKSRPPVRR